MRARCKNAKRHNYKDYGGRGIKVCLEWDRSYRAFFEHVGPKPGAEFTLGRINNQRGYEPGNVRWETMKENQRNKRSNRWIVVRGERKTLAEWAEVSGISKQTIRYRLAHGYSPLAAVTNALQMRGLRARLARP